VTTSPISVHLKALGLRRRLRARAAAVATALVAASLSGCHGSSAQTSRNSSRESEPAGAIEVVSRSANAPETAQPVLPSIPAATIRIRPVALLGPVRDSLEGVAFGVHSESAEAKALRDRHTRDGGYRALIQLLLIVDGPADEVRDLARSIRIVTMTRELVRAFDPRTGERLTAEPGLYSRMISFSPDFISAPISPWEYVHLAPGLQRSIAMIDIELLAVPRPGTRFRLDLSPLARRFERSAENGPAVEFTVESIELELLDP
jgi:hypothetical protein